MDDGGLEGFYDAMLFLVIISVAACMVLTSAATLMGRDDDETRDGALAYARQSLDSLLSSTMSDAFYVNDGGSRVAMANNTTVEEYLLTETYLMVNGFPAHAFLDCNVRIERAARGLVTGAYIFSLETWRLAERGFEEVVVLGASRSSPGYSAASGYFLGGESIRIGLTLWWA